MVRTRREHLNAQVGCALKISTCTSAAVQSALMAIEGKVIQGTDGIIEGKDLGPIAAGPRIGIQKSGMAVHYPWRFWGTG